MSKNYLTYPCKTMRITQSYDGKVSHIKHLNGKPKDYSIDEGGKDGGRDSMYCPCDEMVLSKIRGVGADGTNTIWLTSTKPVVCPDGYEGIVTLQAIHPNDDDLKKLKVGQKFKRGEFICREGSDGASGNHFHFAVGKGKFTGTGWVKNNLGAWVLTTTGGAIKPEDAFFIDPKFTTIKDAKGLKFKQLPKDEPKKTETKKPAATSNKTSTVKKEEYTKGNYVVKTADLLNVRTGAGTNYKKKLFKQLTADAQAKIKKLKGYAVDGYVKGLEFTATSVKTVGKQHWGKNASGWVCLDYCVKI